MYPKLIALDTDGTLFHGWLDQSTWGKGPGAQTPVENNIIKISDWLVLDQSNRNNICGLYGDVAKIITDIRKNGAQIAIVSRKTNKTMWDQVLGYMRVEDEYGTMRPILELVKFVEIDNSDKTAHLNKIKNSTGFNYYDMLMFDDEPTNDTVEMMLGVTFQLCPFSRGLTWEIYQAGLDMWRRNQSIMSPWLGTNLNMYPNKKFLGYSGMDIGTIEALEKGWRRQDRKEEARWGYAMYVADNPAIAKYFSNWIKHNFGGAQARTIVCQIWARDGAIFDRLPKVWVPERNPMLPEMNVRDSPVRTAENQADRDSKIASWGVQKPYILFSRHMNMGRGFPVPNNARWNEMVIYGQVQEALLVTVRMSDQQLDHDIRSGNHLRYEQKLNEWNITVPQETWNDFTQHGENWIRR